MLKRVNLNIPQELIDRLDEYAKENYTTRSSVMCQACDQYLVAKEMQKLFTQMNVVLKKLSAAEKIDEETKRQLDDFERLSKMLSGQVQM